MRWLALVVLLGAGQAGAETREACVDRWLKAQGLNEYGDPPDTAYAGGSPLFNEQTGQKKDRLERIFKNHPEAAKACPNGGKKVKKRSNSKPKGE